MAKTILGIDIGHDQLKLALVRNKKVVKTVSAAMPENLLREGRIVSRESMSDLVRSTLKQNGIRVSDAAFVISNETAYVKNVETPLMSAEQLEYNLPFEFNDYITGDTQDYIFDYAVLSSPETDKASRQKKKNAKKEKGRKNKTAEKESRDSETFENQSEDSPWEENASSEEPSSLQLMVVCCQRSIIEDAQDALRKAGLRLRIAAPAICAYIALLRNREDLMNSETEEFGILDLGYAAIRMYMFHKDRHVATRVLEIGLSTLDNVISDLYGVDVHLAHTYLMTNYGGCQERAECITSYENIAVELMRALNFYRFSNPDSVLGDIWLCGGGAVIRPLTDAIGEMLDVRLHPAAELVPGGDTIEDCNSFVQAVGITMG